MAEFESTNEITVLNPEAFQGHRPIVDQNIKPEPQDLSESFSSAEAQDEDFIQNIGREEFMPPAPPGVPSTSKPGRRKVTAKSIIQDIVSPRTRSQRKLGGDNLPSTFAEQDKRLKIANKKSTDSKTKTLQKPK